MNVHVLESYVEMCEQLYGRSKPTSRIRALSEVQTNHFPSILKTMKVDPSKWTKTGHWIWWVFPTSNIGNNDPYSTRISGLDEWDALLNASPQNTKQWIKILNYIRHVFEYVMTRATCNDKDRPVHFIELILGGHHDLYKIMTFLIEFKKHRKMLSMKHKEFTKSVADLHAIVKKIYGFTFECI